ncbi:MAG: hypothetical protein WBB31_08680 [Saprospiraceae bacterium]
MASEGAPAELTLADATVTITRVSIVNYKRAGEVNIGSIED